MKAPPLSDCPSCQDTGLRRVIGLGAGIIFKGSGFYQTDYRKNSTATNGEKASSDGAQSEKKPGKDTVSSGAKDAKKATPSSPNS